MINIKGLNKAEVFKELYNHSKVQGFGIFQATGEDMTTKEAVALLKEKTDFDYLYGKIMKVDLSSDERFEEHLYDRDNGIGAASRAISSLI